MLKIRHRSNDDVAYNELESAYQLSALVVKMHDEKFLPVFEKNA